MKNYLTTFRVVLFLYVLQSGVLQAREVSSLNTAADNINGNPDLSVTKISNKTTYALSEKATFMITITNLSAVGVSVDSILDELPAGFAYKNFLAGSDINTYNSGSYPNTGATGRIAFTAIQEGPGATSYYVASGESLILIYTATSSSTPSSNLNTSAKGMVGGTEYVSDVNTVNVVNILPINIISMEAVYKNGNNILTWKTANEDNVQMFVIQHGINGSDWADIGMVKASGTVASIKTHTFVHEQPLPGNHFYRLMQIEEDGIISYSKVVSCAFGSSSRHECKIFSNVLSNGILQLQLENPETIYIFNSNAQLMMKKEVKAGIQEVYLENFSKGVYYLRLYDNVKKFVIQ